MNLFLIRILDTDNYHNHVTQILIFLNSQATEIQPMPGMFGHTKPACDGGRQHWCCPSSNTPRRPCFKVIPIDKDKDNSVIEAVTPFGTHNLK